MTAIKCFSNDGRIFYSTKKSDAELYFRTFGIVIIKTVTAYVHPREFAKMVKMADSVYVDSEEGKLT